MHNRHSSSALLRWLIVVAFGVAALGLAAQTAAQGVNLLQNPGFEGDYVPFEGDVSRLVAPGWSAWNVARRSGEPIWSNIKPQYLPSVAPGRVRGGQRAQEFYELYAIFTGGVYQQVAITPGTRLRFSAWINVWSTELDDPARSEQAGQVNVQVGIDPTGGTNGESPAIVWGSSQQFYDEYRQLSVEATATNNVVTVFVRAIMLDPVRHNHVYVDDAELVATEPGAPTLVITTAVAVEPTRTPTPTPLPVSTATPTPTPDPFVPTREGTVQPGPGEIPTREITAGPGFRSPTPSSDADLPGRVTHVVRSGDTVSALAVRYNSRVDAIIRLNGLRSDGLIRVGQQLVIPVPATPGPQPTPTNTLFIAPLPTTPVPGLPTEPGSAPVDTAILNGPTVNGIGTYIMQPGDTLAAVARRYGVTLETLAALNGIVNPSRVVIGQVLAVPGPGNNPPGGTAAPTIVPTVPGAGVQPGGPGTHVVQPGENLFRISLRYNVSMAALMRANGIFNPNLIYAGQVLRIP